MKLECALARPSRAKPDPGWPSLIMEKGVHKAPAVMRRVVRRLVLDVDQHYGDGVASTFFTNC
jgi:hypothetical protein